MISKGRVIRIGLFFAIANFLITAAIGTLLRLNNVAPISDFAVRYWIHGHSHTGFLGWIFSALVIFAFAMFLPKNARINKKIYLLIIYFQIAVLGMLVTFPIMGYAVPSIFFSTMHMILSLVFAIIFFRNADKKDLATKFMKAGLIFMLISGLGPIALGPVMVLGLKGTPWYDMAIYFYLHFQYNGWFTLAVFALFIKLLEHLGIFVDRKMGKTILHLLIYGTIMTLALSALGFGFSPYVQVIGFVGAVVQLGAGFILLKILFMKSNLSNVLINGWAKWFFGLALFSWLMKITLQFLSSIPFISDFVYFNREAIMTYLHLSFLGFTSSFLIALLIVKGYLSTASLASRIALGMFLIAVILMELNLGLKSLPQILTVDSLNFLNYSLFFESVALFGSIIVLLFYGFILPNRAVRHRSR